MSYTVEKDYQYSGCRCVVIMTSMGHRCGYIGINKSHPLYGAHYSKKSEILQSRLEWLKNQEIGKRGIIPTFCWDGKSVSPEILFEVHGGITFSNGGEKSEYPVESNLWWFGFDCAHLDDNPVRCNTAYCVEECNSLAKQLTELMEATA